MNQASPRDPYNNNSYGTLVDRDFKTVSLPILDVIDFNERIIRGYEEGYSEKGLPADLSLARSLVPAGTAPCATSATSRRRSRSILPRTAPAAWTASRSAPTRRSWARCLPSLPGGEARGDPGPADRECSATSGGGPGSITTSRRSRA